MLTVYTGTNPTVMPRTDESVADLVGVRAGAIKNRERNSYFAWGSTELLAPANPLPVTAALAGPNTVSVCDPATFSAAGGRRVSRPPY